MNVSLVIQITYWACLILATFTGFRYFRDLGDITQITFSVKRKNMYFAIRNETKIIAGIFILLLVAAVLHFVYSAGLTWVTVLTIVLNIIFVSFPYLWIHVGLRNQQSTAKYYSIAEANKFVRPETKLIVIENNGEARAHPPLQIRRPHLAGTPEGLGGENVIMSFCAMSHLGMGLVPTIDGKDVQMTVAAQAENNLILKEVKTEQPIQQIYAARTCGGGAVGNTIKQWPTYLMTLRGFAKAYPSGEVFLNKPSSNPFLKAFDTLVEMVFSWALTSHHNTENLMFDRMSNYDDRLRRKELVWGISVNKDSAAYTEDFVRAQNFPVNANVGGTDIVVVFDEEYESLGVFENPAGKKVTKVDFHGVSNVGKLSRLESVRSGLYWFVWANYFPDTDINRLGNG